MGKDLIIASAVGDMQWIRLCIEKGASPTFINDEVSDFIHRLLGGRRVSRIKPYYAINIRTGSWNRTIWYRLGLISKLVSEDPAKFKTKLQILLILLCSAGKVIKFQIFCLVQWSNSTRSFLSGQNYGYFEFFPGFWWMRGVMRGKFCLTPQAWGALALWGVLRGVMRAPQAWGVVWWLWSLLKSRNFKQNWL